MSYQRPRADSVSHTMATRLLTIGPSEALQEAARRRPLHHRGHRRTVYDPRPDHRRARRHQRRGGDDDDPRRLPTRAHLRAWKADRRRLDPRPADAAERVSEGRVT